MSDTIETIQRQIDEDKDAEIESLFQVHSQIPSFRDKLH